MNRWPLLLCVVLLSCPRANPQLYGTVYVGLENCLEPQRTYFVESLEAFSDQLQGPVWRLAIAPQAPDVIVRCADFGPPCQPGQTNCEPGAARFRWGSNTVEVDYARAPGMFAFVAAYRHELIHWRIAQGPHPERARLHVCQFPNEAPDCWSGGYEGAALMGRYLSQGMFDPGFEHVDVGPIATSSPTWRDVEFFQWAASP